MAMGRAVLGLLCAGVACAQTIVDQSKLPQSLRHGLTLPAGTKPLRCDPSFIRPTLNFSFRFLAGYVVRVPMDQYQGPGHTWIIMERITPEGDPSRAVFLGDKFTLPDVPKTNIELPVVGGYLLGE